MAEGLKFAFDVGKGKRRREEALKASADHLAKAQLAADRKTAMTIVMARRRVKETAAKVAAKYPPLPAERSPLAKAPPVPAWDAPPNKTPFTATGEMTTSQPPKPPVP